MTLMANEGHIFSDGSYAPPSSKVLQLFEKAKTKTRPSNSLKG